MMVHRNAREAIRNEILLALCKATQSYGSKPPDMNMIATHSQMKILKIVDRAGKLDFLSESALAVVLSLAFGAGLGAVGSIAFFLMMK